VKAAGVNPLTHFDQCGWKEGGCLARLRSARIPGELPDVAAAKVDPLLHFLQIGAGEGRLTFAPPSALIAANGFDYVWYLQHNPDVAAAHIDAFTHFQTVGWHEGRNPNALFDVSGYLATYADVAAAGINPLDHYHTFGWKEGRDPSVNFDTTSYLAAYADVAAAHVDPLAHFLHFGHHEGRRPSRMACGAESGVRFPKVSEPGVPMSRATSAGAFSWHHFRRLKSLRERDLRRLARDCSVGISFAVACFESHL
jgi:hypothetical protein